MAAAICKCFALTKVNEPWLVFTAVVFQSRSKIHSTIKNNFCMTGTVMNKARVKLTEVSLVSLAGFILLGIVFLTPNGSGDSARPYFQILLGTTWGHLLDWPAAWCSFKLLLFSASLFLLIDSLGTLLLVLNRRHLAGKVFILIVLPFVGLIAGAYYLVKSLL